MTVKRIWCGVENNIKEKRRDWKLNSSMCEQKNGFHIIKAADSYSLSNIYQVSARRIRNLSLGIYLIHYELIIDKHLQSDRDSLLPQRA